MARGVSHLSAKTPAVFGHNRSQFDKPGHDFRWCICGSRVAANGGTFCPISFSALPEETRSAKAEASKLAVRRPKSVGEVLGRRESQRWGLGTTLLEISAQCLRAVRITDGCSAASFRPVCESTSRARNLRCESWRGGTGQDILFAQSASFFCDIHQGPLPVEKKEGLRAKQCFALQNLRASGPWRSALSRWTAAQRGGP